MSCVPLLWPRMFGEPIRTPRGDDRRAVPRRELVRLSLPVAPLLKSSRPRPACAHTPRPKRWSLHPSRLEIICLSLLAHPRQSTAPHQGWLQTQVFDGF